MSITQLHRVPRQSAPSVCAVAAGLTLTLVTGCVVGDQDDSAEFEPEIVAAHVEVLSQLELADGVEMTFSAEYETADRSGEPVLSIMAVGPANAYPYLADFRSRAATTLEAFLALAPAGTEVPAVIRAAHEREAALLARSAAVRAFDLDRAYQPMAVDSASCDSYPAFQSSLSGWTNPSYTRTSGTTSLTEPGTGGNILASVCNHDDPDLQVIDLKSVQFCSLNAIDVLVCEDAFSILDGHRADKAWLGATTSRVVRAIDLAGYPDTLAYLAIGGLVI